jgi:hypothetical protein
MILLLQNQNVSYRAVHQSKSSGLSWLFSARAQGRFHVSNWTVDSYRDTVYVSSESIRVLRVYVRSRLLRLAGQGPQQKFVKHGCREEKNIEDKNQERHGRSSWRYTDYAGCRSRASPRLS